MVEQHLGHALEMASEWLMVLEGKRVIYSNHGAIDMIPTTANGIVGSTLDQVLPGRECIGLDDLLERMGDTQGQIVTGTVECTDELLGPTHLNIRGETRSGYTYLSVDRPVDDVSDPDEKLMEVEDKLSALLGLAANVGLGVGVFEITPEGEFYPRSFNEHVISIFNRETEEMVGKNPADWMHPDDRPLMEEMVNELRETGANSSPIQLRAVDGDGGITYIQVGNSMLSPPNDHLGISFIQDITPMKEALDQQNRMVQAIERVEEAVVLADAMGNIFYVNPAGLRNTGYSLEEVLGQPMAIFAPPEALGEYVDKAMLMLLKRGWWRGDTLIMSKDGTRHPVELVSSAVRDDRGELSMIVVITREIQERQRFEVQLLMAKSNNERLMDHMERQWLPGLERSIREMEKGGGKDMGSVLEDLRTTLRTCKDAIAELPPPEKAQTLRPVRLANILTTRIPSMVARHKVGSTNIEVVFKEPEEDIQVLANAMLPDLIVRILEVLMEVAEFGHPRFTISIGSRKVSQIKGSRPMGVGEGEEPTVGTVSITCQGLQLSDELKGILTHQELQTRGPLSPEQTLVVETSRLLLFIFEGRIITETDFATGEDSVVILLRQP
jgi:PAS domain S-box-containing protein